MNRGGSGFVPDITRRRLAASVALVGTLVAGLFHHGLRAADVAEYRPGSTGPDVVAQLEGLRQALDDGAAESMQELFPEGYVFTWSLYALGFLPVGEAFVVWSKTAQPWVSEVPEDVERDEGWMWHWHLVSLFVVLLLGMPVILSWYRGRRAEA